MMVVMVLVIVMMISILTILNIMMLYAMWLPTWEMDRILHKYKYIKYKYMWYFNGSKNIKFCKEDDKFQSGGQQSDKFEAVKAASREPVA